MCGETSYDRIARCVPSANARQVMGKNWNQGALRQKSGAKTNRKTVRCHEAGRRLCPQVRGGNLPYFDVRQGPVRGGRTST